MKEKTPSLYSLLLVLLMILACLGTSAALNNPNDDEYYDEKPPGKFSLFYKSIRQFFSKLLLPQKKPEEQFEENPDLSSGDDGENFIRHQSFTRHFDYSIEGDEDEIQVASQEGS